MPGPDDLRNILKMIAEAMQSGRISPGVGAQEMLKRARQHGMPPEDLVNLRKALDIEVAKGARRAPPPPGQLLPSPRPAMRTSGVESLDEILGRRVPSGPEGTGQVTVGGVRDPLENLSPGASPAGIRPGRQSGLKLEKGTSWQHGFPPESVKIRDVPDPETGKSVERIDIDMPLDEQKTLLETMMGQEGLSPSDWGNPKTGFFSPKQLNPLSHFPFFGKGGAFRGGRTSSSGFHMRQPESASLLGIPLPTRLMREKVPNTPLMESLIERHKKVQDEIIRSKKMEKRLKQRLFRKDLSPPEDPTSQVRYPSLLEALSTGSP